MILPRVRTVIISVVAWPVTVVLLNALLGPVGVVLWRMMRFSGGTRLAYDTWIMTRAWLPLAVLAGLLAGASPVQQLRNMLRAAFGRFRRASEEQASFALQEDNALLWAWILPSCVLFTRMLLMLRASVDKSVLGGARLVGPGVFDYYFGGGPFPGLNALWIDWLVLRAVLTVPTLALAAYAISARLRQRRALAEHREVTEEKALIDSAAIAE